MRVLVPGVSDVRLVGLAMLGVLDKLARDGIEVHVYERSMLHSKTAILDGRVVVIGSHNLDTFSWRFDLEANVIVDDRAFARQVLASFERDLEDSSRYDLTTMRSRPRGVRVLARLVSLVRSFL